MSALRKPESQSLSSPSTVSHDSKTTTLPVNTILTGDCIAKMAELPAASIDCIFADPPYNLQLANKLHRPDNSLVAAVSDAWDQFASFKVYDEFTQQWLQQCKRLLKPDGSLWVIGSYHNIFRVGKTLQDLNFWILNDIIWRKNNPMPNFRGKRFTNAHETLIWATSAANRKSYNFNYQAMKLLNDDLQMRSDWLIPLCSGKERIKDKDGNKAHSTQKPEALLHRIIMACTNADDVILDPFFGSGTTGAVAKKLGRNFIGIERDNGYVDVAKSRIADITRGQGLTIKPTPGKAKQQRIPFGMLIEHGFILPGTTLTDAKGNNPALVCADGSLYSNKDRGSIHQTGAKLQNAPSCNGWSFWHIEKDGKRMPIDAIRASFRAKTMGENVVA